MQSTLCLCLQKCLVPPFHLQHLRCAFLHVAFAGWLAGSSLSSTPASNAPLLALNRVGQKEHHRSHAVQLSKFAYVCPVTRACFPRNRRIILHDSS